ncbi:MAG: 5-(carboxyamino)imidazole ribonucleotide synthase, partial [Saprospiraceae bacterium]|nr:5-(carboxyamino)imidazole ribonucleotide synthase [Saprospiraceae bacterium]
NLPLKDVVLRSPAVMINILGSPEFTGPPHYNGLDTCMQIDGVHLHLYGKKLTKPFRKMGHATIVAPRLEQAIETAKLVRSTISVTA